MNWQSREEFVCHYICGLAAPVKQEETECSLTKSSKAAKEDITDFKGELITTYNSMILGDKGNKGNQGKVVNKAFLHKKIHFTFFTFTFILQR